MATPRAILDTKRALTPLRGPEAPALQLNRSEVGRHDLTPAADLFICQHHPFPDPGPIDEWSFEVRGTARARPVAVEELRALPHRSVTAVLQCAGNGRAFSEHTMMAPRTPNWDVGAVANVRWTGVGIDTLTELTGAPSPTARFLTATGGDPLREDQRTEDVTVERSVPLAKALADGLLAWEMNGEPIPLEHGGPLRLVVPGYFGINSVKWVTRIDFSRDESTARMQRNSYRIRAVGEDGNPTHPTTWQMPVKSLITAVEYEAGRLVAHGVAFSGGGGIREVEISEDGGASWRSADLAAQSAPFGWRRFSAVLGDGAGDRLVSRATDVHGQVQPRFRRENERGYANNSWEDHAFRVEAPEAPLPSGGRS